MPKPWIDEGVDPDGAAVAYPILPAATADELTAALLAPVGELVRPRDDEKIFSKQRDAHFAMLMSKPA